MEVPTLLPKPVKIAERRQSDVGTQMDILSSQTSHVSSSSTVWKVFGTDMSRSAVVYALQMFILYICIVASFINLTLQNSPKELWIAIIGVSLGCIIPSPKIKKVLASLETPLDNASSTSRWARAMDAEETTTL